MMNSSGGHIYCMIRPRREFSFCIGPIQFLNYPPRHRAAMTIASKGMPRR